MKNIISKIQWSFLLIMTAMIAQSCISENSNPALLPEPSANLEKVISEPFANPLENLRMDPATLKMLADLRAATSKYHKIEVAMADGYAQASPCVSSPAGGMGYHYVNESILDGDFDPTMPEALLYEMDKNGHMKLVAVEFIVGTDDDVNQGTQYFGNQVFDFDPSNVLDFNNYQLHVWVWKNNPAGIFTKFNPNVKCLE
jgi:hypothetical protein